MQFDWYCEYLNIIKTQAVYSIYRLERAADILFAISREIHDHVPGW